MEIITWIITISALIGSYLNSNRDKRGFIIWIITNSLWAIIDYRAGLKAQSALYICYIIMAIRGLITWKKEEEKERGRRN